MSQFINWKLKTDHELDSRRRFTLKYLRQHWDVIEMYMAWIKPYLRHIARLQMNEERLDSYEMVSAFEQSFVETETVFAKPWGKKRDKGMFYVLILTINFRTRPQMSFIQEGYQKGPIHAGHADICLRGYHWDEENIKAYLRMRKEEDLYMLGVIDRSVRAAMEALGDELEQYLAEAGEPKFREKTEKEQQARERELKQRTPSMFGGILEPFTQLVRGWGGAFSMATPKKAKAQKWNFPDTVEGNKKYDSSFAGNMYQHQKNFKKSHKMLSWG